MVAVPEQLERDLESAYSAHFPLLYRRARRWLPPDEAEDLVQETFLRAWKHHGDTNPGVPWLLTVLRNLAIDRSRKKAPILTDDLSTLETPTPEDTADNVIRLEEERRVRSAVAGLTDGQRHAIGMREWGGMSQQEIASSLGTTVPAVESLLLRGRRQLRKALGSAMGIALFPVTAIWRKLQPHLLAGSGQGAAGGLTTTVAQLATAATVIAAGAAAPLGNVEAPAETPAGGSTIEVSAPGIAPGHIAVEPKLDADGSGAHGPGGAVSVPGQGPSAPAKGSEGPASPPAGSGGDTAPYQPGGDPAPPPSAGGHSPGLPPPGHNGDGDGTKGNAPGSDDDPPIEHPETGGDPPAGDADLPSISGSDTGATMPSVSLNG